MDDVKSYGDLSEKELAEFLADIEKNDDELQETRESADDKIADEEAQSSLVETPENAEIEAYYGDDAWRRPHIYTGKGERLTVLYGPFGKRRAAEGRKEAFRKRTQRLKADRIQIQREAFNQELIRLSDDMSKQDAKDLIAELVKEHTLMIDKYSAYINRRLTSLLNPFIPRSLRTCRMAFPDSIKMSPGFMYKASKEYGNGLKFWATPNVPMYFRQNTEQNVLIKNKADFLYSIDKAVNFYYEHLNKRQEKELKYASILIQKGVKTYYDLLKLNPFWFKALYELKLTEK